MFGHFGGCWNVRDVLGELNCSHKHISTTTIATATTTTTITDLMFHLDILTNIMVRTAHEIDKLLKKTGQFQSYPFTGGHFGEHMMTQE